MTTPICPRCSESDQVLSVQSVYAAETGVTDSRAFTVGAVIGAGPVIAGTRSRSSHVTNLARQLTPPATPKRASQVNFGLGVLLFIAFLVIWLGAQGARSSNPPSDRELGAVLMVAGAGLLAAFLLVTSLRWRELQRRYQASLGVWPAYLHVWQNAMVCLRCYGTFFRADALPAWLCPDALIPVGSFHSAVTDIGARLADAYPDKRTQT